MRTVRVYLSALICLAAALALAGCGTGTALPFNAVPTVTLTASPTTIAPNGSTTLTWTSSATTSVSISNGVGAVAASGQVTVKPTQTTTYTISATGGGGTTTASATVTVSAAPPPLPTVTITASPTGLISGASSTLTVTATNATSVVVSDNLDSKTYTLAVTGGTQSVSPTATTIYTATAIGPAGTVTATTTITVAAVPPPPPTVTIAANPAAVVTGSSSTLTVVATNATTVVISNNVDTNTYPLAATGGTQSVTPAKNTIYTATATGLSGTVTATVTVRIVGSVSAVSHVLFMMQENRSFDTYFGMLNPYRKAQSSTGTSGVMAGLPQKWNVGDDGLEYNVDGIDDKLATTTNSTDANNANVPLQSFNLFHTTSTCLDDMTSAWEESYGDVSRYDFTATRLQKPIMDGFVHTAEGFAASGSGSGSFTDLAGKRAMAYYRDTNTAGSAPELNYYYYMASQFALSDRWFSPVSSKSTPNRIATMTGGTTLGLVRDPFVDDKLPTLTAKTIFEELDTATPPVSWKIYYSLADSKTSLPDTTFLDFSYSGKYVTAVPAGGCVLPFVATALNNHCIDSTHIAPLSQLKTDMTSEATMPSFAYIEAEYGVNDEHPGSGQSILQGQTEAAGIINSVMASNVWPTSVFFLTYDEGGGPYDHVPPVPGHSNDKTNLVTMNLPTGTSIPDIGSIAVNPDTFLPCLADGPADINGNPTAGPHCDLKPGEPGTNPADVATTNGFAAQLGFRLPNIVVSPFSRRHFVSHQPMDHTAIIKFVESRFIGPSANLTQRDAAQPVLDFFDFTNVPWLTPPPAANIPSPPGINGTCNPTQM